MNPSSLFTFLLPQFRCPSFLSYSADLLTSLPAYMSLPLTNSPNGSDLSKMGRLLKIHQWSSTGLTINGKFLDIQDLADLSGRILQYFWHAFVQCVH